MEVDDLNDEEDILATYAKLATTKTKGLFKAGTESHHLGNIFVTG